MMLGGPDLGPSADCPSNYPASNHIGHDHPYDLGSFAYSGIDHRLQVLDADLLPAVNPGARYFAEAHYITSDEYVLANGNQNNNVSHQEFGVSGPDANGFFTFTALSGTVVESPAIDAWPGASQSMIEPYPLEDGRAFVAYQVTELGGGRWHYEYIIYNMHLDAAIGRFAVPVDPDVTVQNIEFHAPLAHASEANADHYSTIPWSSTRTATTLVWSTDDFSADPLANAVRFDTAYNFRFDADGPPTVTLATVGIFKTGDEVTAAVKAPAPPLGEPGGYTKNRFVSFLPPPLGAGAHAIRVQLTSLHHPPSPANAPDFSGFEGQYRFVNTFRDGENNPVSACPDSANLGNSYLCGTLGCEPEYREWGSAGGLEPIHVTGAAVVPSSIYSVSMLPAGCLGSEENCSLAGPELQVSTALWGDVDPGQLNIIDVAYVVDKVKDLPTAFAEPRAMLRPQSLDPLLNSVNVIDIGSAVDALKGMPYPFAFPACP
jgi:hypothetical protein